MVNRKEVVILASGVLLAIIALVAVVLVWTSVDNLGKKANDLEQRLTAAENTVDELGEKVDDLEQNLTAAENKADDLENRLATIENKADDLENRLETIENKTWHTVGDFTLSQSKAAETFNIIGEAWRMSYVFNYPSGFIAIGYNLKVLDADGNVVGGLSGTELVGLRDSGKGVLYIPEGQGSYSVEIRGIERDFTFSFTVEEFY